MVLRFTVPAHWVVFPEEDPVPLFMFTFKSIGTIKSGMYPHLFCGVQSGS